MISITFVPVRCSNSEKRKEKSRDAARYRRSKESDIFTDLTQCLPLQCSTSTTQLDKASVVRLAIAYIKSKQLVLHENGNDTLKKKE